MPKNADTLLAELKHLLSSHTTRISYQAFRDEPEPNTIPLLKTSQPKERKTLPQRQTIEPITLAKELEKACVAHQTHILIPGRAFDLTGTRHGRGFGWYDRLLAHLPKDILRIGIAQHDQLHTAPLRRQPWDEPVDWLIYQQDSKWKVHKTHAREP